MLLELWLIHDTIQLINEIINHSPCRDYIKLQKFNFSFNLK